MSDVSRTDVLVLGEYYCDLVFTGLDGAPRPGTEVFAAALNVRPGGCYNMALALTRLGVETAWSVDFGTDLFSRLVLDQAARDGVSPVAFNVLGRDVARVSAAFAEGSERGFISYSTAPVVPPETALLDRLRPRWLLQSFRYDAGWLDFLLSPAIRFS